MLDILIDTHEGQGASLVVIAQTPAALDTLDRRYLRGSYGKYRYGFSTAQRLTGVENLAEMAGLSVAYTVEAFNAITQEGV